MFCEEITNMITAKEIYKKIEVKKALFKKKYGFPKYVILSFEQYEILSAEFYQTIFFRGTCRFFDGLEILISNRIETLDDIEVY